MKLFADFGSQITVTFVDVSFVCFVDLFNLRNFLIKFPSDFDFMEFWWQSKFLLIVTRIVKLICDV